MSDYQDFIGHDLVKGDYVAGIYSEDCTPAIFQIVGFTPKKVRLSTLAEDNSLSLKFPDHLIKLDASALEERLTHSPTDKLGQPLAIDDCVYGSGGEYIEPIIFRITGFLPLRAYVTPILGDTYARGDSRFTHDLIKVNPHDVTMCVLKAK